MCQQILFFTDKVNKINRTTLNTWYEIKSMNEKIEKLETNLFMISNNRMQVHTDDSNFDSMNTFDEVMMSVLPIVNEESLTTFEKNLLDNNLKNKVVRFKVVKCITIMTIIIYNAFFKDLSYRI